jgi:hypothetical protein
LDPKSRPPFDRTPFAERLGSKGGDEEAEMANVQVEAARIPDRDRLLETLHVAGLQARAVNEVGIEVPTGDEGQVFAEVERMILDLGEPFVPIEHEGVIYIRPPTS